MKPFIETKHDICNYLSEYWECEFRDFTLLGCKRPVLGAITNENLGAVDFVFCRKKFRYCMDVSYGNGGKEDFWQALQITPKCEALKIHNELLDATLTPVIMMCKNEMTNAKRIILARLQVRYILFELTTDDQLKTFDFDGLIG